MRLEKETVWLSLDQMTKLFGRERSALPKHIGGVFWGKEPYAKSVSAKFAQTAEDNLMEDADGIETNFTGIRRRRCCFGMGDSLGYAVNHRPEIAPGEFLASGRQLLPKMQQLNSKAMCRKCILL